MHALETGKRVMPEFLNCPSCKHPLRVPDTLLGQMVKCPACGLTFTAGAPSGEPPGEAAVVAPESEPADLPEGPVARPLPPRRPASASLVGPGVALLISGLLGLIGCPLMVLSGAVVDKDTLKAAMTRG